MENNERALVNRKNAAKSTGPKTVAGKGRSRLNAVSHGLRSLAPVLPGERAKDWEAHRAGVVASLAPVGRLEEELAERAALCLWRMRRVAGFEAGVVAADVADVIDAPSKRNACRYLGLLPDRSAGHFAALDALASKRESVAAWQGADDLVDRLAGLPGDAPLDGCDVERLLDDLGEEDDEGINRAAQALLRPLGVPAEFAGRLGEWEGWTAGKVRQAVGLIAAASGGDPERMLASVRDGRAAIRARYAGEISALEEEVRKHERKQERQKQREACAALLPDARTLDKLMRYEAHIGRQLTQALHALERLQKMRAGQDVPAPQALDVTIDAPA